MIERLPVHIPAGAAGEFSPPELTYLVELVCADSYFGVRSTPVLPQWHVKDPGHSAKSVSVRLHLNMRIPFDPTKSERADYAAVQT